jgi:Protein of unknown function (DUF3592)
MLLRLTAPGLYRGAQLLSFDSSALTFGIGQPALETLPTYFCRFANGTRACVFWKNLVKINQSGLKAIQIVGVVLFGGFMFFASYVIHANNVGLNIKDMPTVVGRIVDRHLTRRTGGGKGGNPLVLAFELDNLDQTLGIYNPSQDYSELLDLLHVGDTVTVYYRPLSTNPIDIDVFQVEENKRIIVDYADYSKNHSVASTALAIFGSIFLLIGMVGIWMNTQMRQKTELGDQR